jgi:dimethylglycine dehydrogenase
LKTHAQVVVIGGGAVGCSALYHLTQLGVTDAVLLERDELTAGSTWHAAGNCPNFSTSWNVLKLQRHSTRLYASLARTVGYDIDYHVTGSIRLAHTRDRVDEFRHVASQARAQGIEFELLSPAEIAERHPFVETHDILAGLYDPYDGDIDPAQLTQALAKGSRDAGAVIHRGTKVTAIERQASGEWLLRTNQGDIRAGSVINAAGYRGGEVAAMVGAYLPIVTLSHQYLVTEALPGLVTRGQRRLPLLRDPDVSYYLRQERHGFILGPYENRPQAHWLQGIPEAFAHQLFDDDLGRLEPYIEAAYARVPILGTAGVRRVINGPIPYAPDGNPLIGPAPGLPGFFHCCAFTFGIAQAGGAGKVVAEWVVHGTPEWDVWPLDSRRYHDYADDAFVLAKAVETYRHEYGVGYPVEERPAGRPAKTSPAYSRLAAKGARFGARGGWERAVYFPRPDDPTEPELSFRRPAWHAAVRRECDAVQNRVAVLDLPGFTRFEVAGSAAATWLDHMVAGVVPKPGRTALNYLLDDRGGVVTEMTLTTLGDGRHWLIGAAAGERHDEHWLRAHLPGDTSVSIDNLTSHRGTLIVAGPRSRELLSRLSPADFSNAAFPWLAAREIEVGSAKCVAIRVNYVGELGWELHVPMDDVLTLYDLLCSAGEPLGIADFGLYAMDSLRLEKGYPAWKADLTTEYTPAMASLDRFVRLDKPGGFVGQPALQRERARGGPTVRFVPLLVDAGDADAAAVSIVFHDDEQVGLVTSGGYGYRIGRSIALAFLRADLARAGTAVDVEILGERRTAVVAEATPYDPENRRVRM